MVVVVVMVAEEGAGAPGDLSNRRGRKTLAMTGTTTIIVMVVKIMMEVAAQWKLDTRGGQGGGAGAHRSAWLEQGGPWSL